MGQIMGQIMGQCDVAIVDTLKHGNGGDNGKWGEPQRCELGQRVRGFSVLETCTTNLPLPHHVHDNIAAHAIRLFCSSDDAATLHGSTSITVMNYDEPTSILMTADDYWLTPTFCPAGTWMIGFDQKVQPDQGSGGDDSAVTTIKAKCSDHTELVANYDDKLVPVVQVLKLVLQKGTYNGFEVCPPDSFVCGYNQRVLSDQGGGDDSGLNDVEMYCCQENCSKVRSVLRWIYHLFL